MEWWERVSLCVRRLWISVGVRLGGRRRTEKGLTKLRKEVSACEYEDVHVMWELLRESRAGGMVHHHRAKTPRTPDGSRQPWDVLHWPSCGTPYH